MEIVGFLKTSLIEWPGKITSVIFTPGCNFRCPFCHNANLVNTKVKKLPRIDEKRILADLDDRRKWVDGVVVTGGEPTLQTDLSRFLSRIKQRGFLRMIHTNGTRPEVISKLVISKLVDYYCLDLKGDLENYSNYSNCSNDQAIAVKESLKLIIESGVEYEFRTTVVPSLHSRESLIKLASQIRSEIENCRWFLQQFRPMNTLDKKFLQIKPYSREEMEEFQKELRKIIPNVFLRGV